MISIFLIIEKIESIGINISYRSSAKCEYRGGLGGFFPLMDRYSFSTPLWEDIDFENVIERIMRYNTRELILNGGNLFTAGALSDQLVHAICSCTRLVTLELDITHIPQEHQLLLSRYIRNSGIKKLTLTNITEHCRDIVIDSMTDNNNLYSLQLIDCYYLNNLLDEIAAYLPHCAIQELKLTCPYSGVVSNAAEKFSDIQNTKLRIFDFGYSHFSGRREYMEKILENNMHIVDIGILYNSEMLRRNKKIAQTARDHIAVSHQNIIDLYTPGNPRYITSHKHVLQIIADKVLDSRDDNIWTELAYSRIESRGQFWKYLFGAFVILLGVILPLLLVLKINF